MARQISMKRIAINRTQLVVVVVASVTGFIFAFCMVGAKNMLDQRAYQAKVIGKKKVALSTLKKNQSSFDSLRSEYEEFDGQSSNVLGGSKAGKSDRDGSNTRIVLDALPSRYDFPALTASIEKLFKDNAFELKDISGTDDEVAQSQEGIAPVPVEIPISMKVTVNGQTGASALQLLERSIRPIHVSQLNLKVNQGTSSELTVTAKTFYQQEKKFEIQMEQVR